MSNSPIALRRASPPQTVLRRLKFGVGSIGTGIFFVVPGVLLLYYLTTVVHVPPAFAGLIILTPKILSIFTDPIVGHVSDHVKIRSEAHRRWFMFTGAVASGLGLWAIFTLPARISGGGWLAGGLYLVSVFGFSFFAVPYSALPADLEPSVAERRGLVSTRIAISFAGGMIGAVAAPIIVGWAGYAGMGLTLGLICFGAVTLCVSTYSASHGRNLTPSAPEKLSLSGLADRTYLRVLAGFVLLVVSSTTVNAAMPFLVEGLFKKSSAALGTALLVNTGFGLVSTVLWPMLLKEIGQTLAWRVAAALMITSVGCLALSGGPNPIFVGGLVLGGLGFGGVQITGFVALADAANRSEALGRSGSGVLTGLWLAGEKIGSALGPLLVGIVMQIAMLPGGSSREALSVAIGILPAILSGTAALVLWRRSEDATTTD